jgi:hypothetical protein
VVNVLWGALNLAIGYGLVARIGEFHLRNSHDMLIAGIGGLLMGLMLAQTFSRNV